MSLHARPNILSTILKLNNSNLLYDLTIFAGLEEFNIRFLIRFLLPLILRTLCFLKWFLFLQLSMELCKIPHFGKYFSSVRITTNCSQSCASKDLFYLELVDLIHNAGNQLVCDRRLTGGEKIKRSVPGSVTKALVAILQ